MRDRWISIKDRIPEYDVYVLIVWDGGIYIAELQKLNIPSFFVNGRHYIDAEDADYWMSLPEPPKDEI